MAKPQTIARRWLHGKWGTFTLAAAGTVASALLEEVLRVNGIERVGVATGASVFAGFMGSLLGGVASNKMADEASDFERRLTGEDGIVNHDLQKLVRAALAEVCQRASRHPDLDSVDRDTLQRVGKAIRTLTEDQWQALIDDERLGDAAAEIRPEETIRTFERNVSFQSEPSALPDNDWHLLVSIIAGHVHIPLGENLCSLVAKYGKADFPALLRELVKADFEENGKQFAAVSLSLLGNLAVNVAGLHSKLDGAAESQQKLLVVMRDLHERFEKIEPQVNGKDIAMVPRLRGLILALERLLTSIHTELAEHRHDFADYLKDFDKHRLEMRQLLAQSTRADSPPKVSPDEQPAPQQFEMQPTATGLQHDATDGQSLRRRSAKRDFVAFCCRYHDVLLIGTFLVLHVWALLHVTFFVPYGSIKDIQDLSLLWGAIGVAAIPAIVAAVWRTQFRLMLPVLAAR